MSNSCSNCKYDTRGRVCPIFSRLHVQSVHLKIWSLNRTNFSCNLWSPFGSKKYPSCLDKFDQTRRLELLEKEQTNRRIAQLKNI